MSNFSISLQLVVPTDFLILEAFSNGQNYTAGAVAYRIEHELDSDHEVSKENINTRLPKLEGKGLLEKIPATGRSGLYCISEAGRIALENRDQYDSPDVDFVELIKQEIRERS